MSDEPVRPALPRVTLLLALLMIGVVQTLNSCGNNSDEPQLADAGGDSGTLPATESGSESAENANSSIALILPGVEGIGRRATGTWALRCVLNEAGDSFISKRVAFGENSLSLE